MNTCAGQRGLDLHHQSAGAPSEENVSRRVGGLSAKIQRRVRRAVFGLMALPLASLRDAVVRGIRFRWYRFAQPPATGFHASVMRFRLHKIESRVTFRSHTQRFFSAYFFIEYYIRQDMSYVYDRQYRSTLRPA